MSVEPNNIDALKELQSTFRSKFQALKKAKNDFLKLFRMKLEEKKIEEIKKEMPHFPRTNRQG